MILVKTDFFFSFFILILSFHAQINKIFSDFRFDNFIPFSLFLFLKLISGCYNQYCISLIIVLQ